MAGGRESDGRMADAKPGPSASGWKPAIPDRVCDEPAVMPAKAGIRKGRGVALDPRFRGDDSPSGYIESDGPGHGVGDAAPLGDLVERGAK